MLVVTKTQPELDNVLTQLPVNSPLSPPKEKVGTEFSFLITDFLCNLQMLVGTHKIPDEITISSAAKASIDIPTYPPKLRRKR